MKQTVRKAINEEIAAIESDPIGWAREHEESILATMGSGAMHAKKLTAEELSATAARHLASARKLIEVNPIIEQEEKLDVPRLMRANRRTHEEVGY